MDHTETQESTRVSILCLISFSPYSNKNTWFVKQYKENVLSFFYVGFTWLVPPLNMYPAAVPKKIGTGLLEICNRAKKFIIKCI